MNKVGTWLSVSDAAMLVGTLIFVVSEVFFIVLYYMVIKLLGYRFFISFWNMDRTQLVLVIMFSLFTVASTVMFTVMFIKIYDMLINTPVSQLMFKMKDLGKGDQINYLISGKISNPFKANTGDETWMELVQNYLDVTSAEKYIDELTGWAGEDTREIWNGKIQIVAFDEEFCLRWNA